MTQTRAGARLAAVAAFVPPGSRIADVGSGPGALPLHLLEHGRARWAIATEKTPDRARMLTALGPVPGLEVRTGDGLAPLSTDDRIEVLIMAGFGGETMVKILGGGALGSLGCPKLVLQPHGGVAPLRRWLVAHGLAVVAERMVQERGRFYVALAATQAGAGAPTVHPHLGPDELIEAGPCLVYSGDPLVAQYWRRQAARYEHILRHAVPSRGRDDALAGRELARRILESLVAG